MYGDETLYASSQAISLNPYNPDNYIILGYIYQFNSDEELQAQAEQVFIQAYNLQPSYALSIFALGNYLEFVERYDESVALYQNSINSFYSEESDINKLLNERIGLVEEKKEGVKTDTSEPSDEEINDKVQENLLDEDDSQLDNQEDEDDYKTDQKDSTTDKDTSDDTDEDAD